MVVQIVVMCIELRETFLMRHQERLQREERFSVHRNDSDKYLYQRKINLCIKMNFESIIEGSHGPGAFGPVESADFIKV